VEARSKEEKRRRKKKGGRGNAGEHL